MGISTSTGTLTAGQSRTFNLSPASAVTLTLSPNVRVTITETPATVAATGLGGNASRVHEPRLPGSFTYGPYPMGGAVVVENESNSGSSVGWVRSDSIIAESADGSQSLVDGAGNSGLTVGARSGLLNPSGLQRWWQMLAEAQFARVPVYCIGDSTTAGTGASYPTMPGTDAQNRPGTYATQLGNLFSPTYGAAGFHHALETDVVINSGGDTTTTIGVGGYSRGLLTGQTCTFASPVPCTTLEIAYWDNNNATIGGTTGAWRYAVDGGGWVAVPNAGVSNEFKRVTISGLSASATHTVVVEGTEGVNKMRLLGMGYHSGKGIMSGRYGRPGWSLVDSFCYGLNNSTIPDAQKPRLVNGVNTWGPGLLIIPTSINEFSSQGTSGNSSLAGVTYTSPEHMGAMLDIVIAAAVAAGSCVLLVVPAQTSTAESGTPSSGASPAGLRTWDEYRAVLKSKAVAGSHVACIDFTQRWGGYTAANAAGLMADAAHPRRVGYGDQARVMQQLLAYA